MPQSRYLSGFSDEEMIIELRKRSSMPVLLRDATDHTVLEEAEKRGLNSEIVDDYLFTHGPTLSDASDEEVTDEYDRRELSWRSFSAQLEKIRILVSTHQPYQDEVTELIYEYTGRMV